MNPQASLQSLAETGTANLAMARSLTLSALAFAERVSAAQMEFVRTSFEQAADFAPLEDGKLDWSSLAARQNAALREAAERTGALVRLVCEAGSEAQAAATEAVSSRMAEMGEGAVFGDIVKAIGAASLPARKRKAA